MIFFVFSSIPLSWRVGEGHSEVRIMSFPAKVKYLSGVFVADDLVNLIT